MPLWYSVSVFTKLKKCQMFYLEVNCLCCRLLYWIIVRIARQHQIRFIIFNSSGFHSCFFFFTQSQEIQKTIDIAAMLVSQTKEIIKILLLEVHQHGRHDVRWKPAIINFCSLACWKWCRYEQNIDKSKT